MESMMVATASVDETMKRLSDLISNDRVTAWGVKHKLNLLKNDLETMIGFLDVAERREHKDEDVMAWLNRLRRLFYDIEDAIDDFHVDINNTGSNCFFSFHTRRRSRILKRIRAIHADLKLIRTDQSQHLSLAPGKSKGDAFVVLPDEEEIIGIDGEIDGLVQLLRAPPNVGGRVTAILGTGGIGKTTLVQKVLDDERIRYHFDVRIWVRVSRHFDENDLLRQIIRYVAPVYDVAGCLSWKYKETLIEILEEIMVGKRVLLVLEDLWSSEVWDCLLKVHFNRVSCYDSKVLITSRVDDVARQMGASHCHQMKGMSLDDGWSLLRKVVLGGGDAEELEHLKDVGMKMVQKCSGIPLAVKAMGGILCTKERSKMAWENVLSSLKFSSPSDPLYGIMPALLVGYKDLPSHLKACFLYCSLFPNGYLISRTSLTQMWIAEGFIKEEGEVSMEDMADVYLEELLMRSLLQAVDSHLEGHAMLCKMHNCVHELAVSVIRCESAVRYLQQGSQGGVYVKPQRHLSISGDEEMKDFPERVKKQEYYSLRSLLVFPASFKDLAIPEGIFEKLRHLRVLNLSHMKIHHLPESFGEVMQLRYLDLSYTLVGELPESMCNLQNLQTLALRHCINLSKLPGKLPWMVSLRHIDVDESKHVILRGIGRLTRLQTLRLFRVYNSNDDGSGPLQHRQCNIEELKYLSELRCLGIENLDKVPGRVEAKEAMIRDKIHLKSLSLGCSNPGSQEPEEGEMNRIEEVFEELCPPPSLESLLLHDFFGRKLPSWMSSSLWNLKYLKLHGLINLQQLPSLGCLPQLREIDIDNNCAIVSVGSEFLFCGGGRRGVVFPKLEVLSFRRMYVWKEWDDESQLLSGIILPCLRVLKIEYCPELVSIPMGLLRHATNLTEMLLRGVRRVDGVGDLLHVRKLCIYYCTKVERLWNLPRLEILSFAECDALKDMINLGATSSLRYILFDHQRGSIPPDNVEALKNIVVMDEIRLVLSVCRYETELKKYLPKDDDDDAPYWPLIRRFPYVHARAHGGPYFNYTRSTSEFVTNITSTSSSSPSTTTIAKTTTKVVTA
ncbi:putative disease resistance RPP13-like protein 1 [Acorus calamus]|uniref:Disease resistance RPP13-like protein 1 n=1 Tax=Acorus calamus TaxID=4465 RepID=A0AAV9DAQ9_ACOCL|nr:putative disease resistance RPP13-like protein 1 [Acorus calamus]